MLSLLEASRAKADVMNEAGDGFRYPSYVEDIMVCRAALAMLSAAVQQLHDEPQL